ncbi:hypothetical protein ACJ72_00102 [Emergomyces africanus]|uniref:Uncharacterized protein n=1 Tax=Emergomyces africanus TaxID=1955775 RepID=A0A1B7P931_9EURO|nr:hypothetical protein ACJ72_00102 [Emergomyces africanus]
MKWTLVAALLAQPALSRISPYDREDSERPDNVTGLDFYYYHSVGTYYNGTFSISIAPMYNPPDYRSENTEYPCQEHENSTFGISMNAIAGFLENSPKSKPTNNPFYFTIEAWDKRFNLTRGTGPTQRTSANYSKYQENHVYSGSATSKYGPIWQYNLTDGPSNGDDEAKYRFEGRMNSVDFLLSQNFNFNASDVCKERDKERLLFSGSLVSTGSREKYDWTKNPVPAPRISGSFGTRTAHVSMSGYFIVSNDKFDAIVGRADMVFYGVIDEERSDQLFMDRPVPEWNATLGFARGSVGGANAAAPQILGMVGNFILIAFTGLSIAVPLIFF